MQILFLFIFDNLNDKIEDLETDKENYSAEYQMIWGLG